MPLSVKSPSKEMARKGHPARLRTWAVFGLIAWLQIGLISSVDGQDWSQYRGPQRDGRGTAPEVGGGENGLIAAFDSGRFLLVGSAKKDARFLKRKFLMFF